MFTRCNQNAERKAEKKSNPAFPFYVLTEREQKETGLEPDLGL
jgi:hypothetical protein